MLYFSKSSGKETYHEREEDTVCDERKRSADEDKPSIFYQTVLHISRF